MRRARQESRENAVKVKVILRADRPRYVLRWIDPATGRTRERLSKAKAVPSKRRLAEREASDLEDELASVAPVVELGWEGFKLAYLTEHLSGLAPKTRQAWHTAVRCFELIARPARAQDVTPDKLGQFVAACRVKGLSEPSIASYLRSLHAFFGWGANVKRLFPTVAPRIRLPKRAKGKDKFMRSRPITGEEFDRLLLAVKKVRPQDFQRWRLLLKGLWWGGLRLGEALVLSWDLNAPISVLLDGKYPLFRVLASGEKGHQDRLLPMAPEMAAFLAKCPKSQRRGKVFRIAMSAKRIGRVLSDIGRHSKIVTATGDGTEATKKFVTAHDLRRSFGTRWADRIMPMQLRDLMRHSAIETTLRYYVQFDLDTMGKALQAATKATQKTTQKGDMAGDKPRGGSPAARRRQKS